MTRSIAHPSTPRLYVDYVDAPLHARAEIPASAEQTHYLRNVLRRESGDPIRLFNGTDGEWLARIIFGGKRSVMFVDEPLRAQQPEPGPWLAFALLKRDATDLVVRQAVELGAARILPIISERTNTARVNKDRLRAIAIEAAEQSDRLSIPVIDAPARLDAVLAAWPTGRRLFAAIERSWTGQPCHDIRSDGGPGALLVGPEGGFTASEREMLHRFDFVTPISLGPFVLRAETAAASGLALLLGMGWAEYVGST
jgi:16S rRNA (uracil1498-N3)-methyltransferase